jgi:hypothetical protein
MRKTIIYLFALIHISSFAQNEISGTVTFYFNEYQGNKVDVGAKVYLIDSLTFIKTKNFENLINYNSLKIKRNLANYYIEDLIGLQKDVYYNKLLKDRQKLEKKDKHLKEKYKEKHKAVVQKIESHEIKIEKKNKEFLRYTNELKENKVFEDEQWRNYCLNAFKAIMNLTILKKENTKTKTVNGIGTYTFKNIENGVYYIIMKSENRTGLNALNITGKVNIRKVIIKNQDIDFSYNFSLN